MLAEPEPLPAWHTPAPRQRRRTSRASRQPHGLRGTRPPRAARGQNRGGKNKPRRRGRDPRERRGFSRQHPAKAAAERCRDAGSAPQPRLQGRRRGGRGPGPAPAEGPAAGSGHRAPRPPRRGLRGRPRSPRLTLRRPVPSRPSRGGEAWVDF